MQSWHENRFPLKGMTFEPVTRDDLALAHSKLYVADVLDGVIANGFGTKSAKVAESLPYTVGSFVAAAYEALRNGQVACSPTSGFHHAEYDKGMGFCTFNGLMVAAARLLAEGKVKKLGILDLDAHHGNGTEDIIERLKLEKRIKHFTRGDGAYKYDPKQAEEVVRGIRPMLKAWKAEGIELLLYQAGADSHIDDPMGGGFFPAHLMRERDRNVFAACKELGLPVAWNLAGGYQEDERFPFQPKRIRKVLDIHDDTMEECVRVFAPTDYYPGW